MLRSSAASYGTAGWPRLRPADGVDSPVRAPRDFSTGVPTPARGIGPQPVRFTEGTLVIDLVRPGGPNPVWRGVYRDEESTGSKLMLKLPEDAKKLIDRYPRRNR